MTAPPRVLLLVPARSYRAADFILGEAFAGAKNFEDGRAEARVAETAPVDNGTVFLPICRRNLLSRA